MEGKFNFIFTKYILNNFYSFICRTLEERAQRLFSTKGKGFLDPSLMTKNNKGKATKEKEILRQRELATLEAQTYRLLL